MKAAFIAKHKEFFNATKCNEKFQTADEKCKF